MFLHHVNLIENLLNLEKRGGNGAEGGAERGDLKIFRGGAGRLENSPGRGGATKNLPGAGRNGAPFADP